MLAVSTFHLWSLATTTNIRVAGSWMSCPTRCSRGTGPICLYMNSPEALMVSFNRSPSTSFDLEA